jgi:hypothetical protein
MQVAQRPLTLTAPPVLRPQPGGAATVPGYAPLRSGDQLVLSKGLNRPTTPPPLKQQVARWVSNTANKPLLDHFRSFATNPTHQPVVAALYNRLQQSPAPSFKTLEALALDMTDKTYGRSLKPARQAQIAYEALISVAIEKGFRDPSFFRGESDKVLHYLASAIITTQAYQTLPLDDAESRPGAYYTAHTLGYLKEAFSIPFSHEDMVANEAGIDAALKMITTLRHQRQIVGIPAVIASGQS